jgi:hypothetical protein
MNMLDLTFGQRSKRQVWMHKHICSVDSAWTIVYSDTSDTLWLDDADADWKSWHYGPLYFCPFCGTAKDVIAKEDSPKFVAF